MNTVCVFHQFCLILCHIMQWMLHLLQKKKGGGGSKNKDVFGLHTKYSVSDVRQHVEQGNLVYSIFRASCSYRLVLDVSHENFIFSICFISFERLHCKGKIWIPLEEWKKLNQWCHRNVLLSQIFNIIYNI